MISQLITQMNGSKVKIKPDLYEDMSERTSIFQFKNPCAVMPREDTFILKYTLLNEKSIGQVKRLPQR